MHSTITAARILRLRHVPITLRPRLLRYRSIAIGCTRSFSSSSSSTPPPNPHNNFPPRTVSRIAKTNQIRALKRQLQAPITNRQWKIAIVGRPNVGKSTLFNRLIDPQEKKALVDKRPGVTRDRQEAIGTLFNLNLTVMDTAGLEDIEFLSLSPGRQASRSSDEIRATHYNKALSKELQMKILQQTEQAMQHADLILFVIDGREGITPVDEHFAQWVRKRLGTPKHAEGKKAPSALAGQATPIILVANKCDSSSLAADQNITEMYQLGFGDPVLLSAHHRDGFTDLHGRLTMEFSRILESEQEMIIAGSQAEQATSKGTKEGVGTKTAQEPVVNRRTQFHQVVTEQGDVDISPEVVMELREEMDRVADEEDDDGHVHNLRLAIVGKPNVGKSTLVNALLGDERVLTGPEPGVTRDAISLKWIHWRLDGLVDRKTTKGEDDEDIFLRAVVSDEKYGTRSVIIPSPKVIEQSSEAADVIKRTATDTKTEYVPYPSLVDDFYKNNVLTEGSPEYVFQLIDTAGIKGLTDNKLARFSKVDAMAMSASIRAIEHANVVALVLDVSSGINEMIDVLVKNAAFETEEYWNPTPGTAKRKETVTVDQGHAARLAVERVFAHDDISIARRAVDEGRALIIIANKWDKIEPSQRSMVLFGLQRLFQYTLAQARGVPIIPISAASKQNISLIVPYVIKQFNRWHNRVATAPLNLWFRALTRFHPPPGFNGRSISFKYITQASRRPPTFVAFSSRAHQVPPSYVTFLINSLRDEFDLHGVPIRLSLKAPKNPFQGLPRRRSESAAAYRLKRRQREAAAQQRAPDLKSEKELTLSRFDETAHLIDEVPIEKVPSTLSQLKAGRPVIAYSAEAEKSLYRVSVRNLQDVPTPGSSTSSGSITKKKSKWSQRSKRDGPTARRPKAAK